jgi:hypothetical protein
MFSGQGANRVGRTRSPRTARQPDGRAMREAFGVRPVCCRCGTVGKREQAPRTPNAGACRRPIWVHGPDARGSNRGGSPRTGAPGSRLGARQGSRRAGARRSVPVHSPGGGGGRETSASGVLPRHVRACIRPYPPRPPAFVTFPQLRFTESSPDRDATVNRE